MQRRYAITIVTDGPVEPWEGDRIDLVVGETLEAWSLLLYDRLRDDLGRTVEARISPTVSRSFDPGRTLLEPERAWVHAHDVDDEG